MPKTLGIIAEYDPFHKGHAWCLSNAKRMSQAERTICVMSGPFTQRGEPALIDKYLRAEAAVRNGVDLVLELPFVYAATGTENFARGGIRILAGLGVIDAIAFGSESAADEAARGKQFLGGSRKADVRMWGSGLGASAQKEIEDADSVVNERVVNGLKKAARTLAFESPIFTAALFRNLKTGVSYPAARQAAMTETVGAEAAAFLARPNDLLGAEYIRQLYIFEADSDRGRMLCYRPMSVAGRPVFEDIPESFIEYIHPGFLREDPAGIELYAIPRIGAGPDGINTADGFAGAGAIRAMMRNGKIGQAFSYLPAPTVEVIQKLIHTERPQISLWDLRTDPAFQLEMKKSSVRAAGLAFPEQLFDPLQYAMLAMEPDELHEMYAAAEGLENRLFQVLGRAKSYNELIAGAKSKRYTDTRIRRLILHAALRLKKSEMKSALAERLCARVLAFNDVGAEILRDMKTSASSVVLYQNLKQQQDVLVQSRMAIGLGIRADKLYHTLVHGSLVGFRYSPEPFCPEPNRNAQNAATDDEVVESASEGDLFETAAVAEFSETPAEEDIL